MRTLKPRVKVDGVLLEEIEVTNGLKQGCTLTLHCLTSMLATLLNIGWTGSEGVGSLIINKQDGLLFQKSTRYANRIRMYKDGFADDDVRLLAHLREARRWRSKEVCCY